MKKINKNLEKRILAGVAAGLSDSFGLNANIFRAGFLLLAILTKGLGVVPYILLGLLLPMRPEDKAAGRKTSLLTFIFALLALGLVVGVFMPSTN